MSEEATPKVQSPQATSLRELVDQWKGDVESGESQQTAYAMVGRLAGNDHWDEWYDGNEKIAEVFNLAADLEMPDDIHLNSIHSDEDRPKVWARIKELIAQLDGKVQ